MNIVEISIDAIDDKTLDIDYRSQKREFVENLAKDIEMVGLRHPITVKHIEDGKYLLVAGWHRLQAFKLLERDTIPCQIINETDDFVVDDETCLVLSVSENILRNQLSPAQQSAALKKYEEYFTKWLSSRHPYMTQGAKKREFRKKILESTKQNPKTFERNHKISQAFTDEQLQVLDLLQLNQNQLLQVAEIKDQKEREGVVSLLAAGLPLQEAINQSSIKTSEEPEIVKELKRRKPSPSWDLAEAEAVGIASLSPVLDIPQEKPQDEKVGVDLPFTPEEQQDNYEFQMQDKEWLDIQCSGLSQHLQNPSNFNGDALLYRNINEYRRDFRIAIQEFMAQAKKGCHGPLYRLLEKIVNLSHPKDWHLCGDCSGGGCRSCKDCGYWVTSEEYKK